MSTLGGDQGMTTVSEAGMYEDEKSKFSLGLSGGATWCVNEAGLYRLALASRKNPRQDPSCRCPYPK